MSAIVGDGPPEAKKFRIDLETQDGVCSTSPTAPSPEGTSPAGPSSARSSNGSIISNDMDKEEETEGMTGSLLEMISKSLLGNVFKMEDVCRPVLPPSLCSSPTPSSIQTATTPIPGALAVAQSPAAQLFANDDWSWHRNPAAAIRSGGTNKQTPVWKYFVYNKTENLSRCIIGDCSYMLKGPHTSTLACHLKKHPNEYNEFQRLKVEYTRDRHGGAQLPPSPSSSSAASSISATNSTIPQQTSIKPQKKKENKQDISNMLSGFRSSNNVPSMPSLMQNLLGAINPLQLIINNGNNSINATQTTNHMLQNAGLSLTANGQLVQCKKWRRDERRQRELENRLALAIVSSHLSLDVIQNPLWKEFIEAAQPKFSMTEDVPYFEQLVSSQYARLQQCLRTHLSSSHRIFLLVDGLRVSSPSSSSNGSAQSDDIIRLSVCASFMSMSNHKVENNLIFLAFRPLIPSDNLSESISSTIEQVITDYDISSDKIVRILCSGLNQILDDDDGNVIDKQMEPYTQRIQSCYSYFLDTNTTVDEVKRALFSYIFSFVTRPEALELLNKATGCAVDLPLTEPFPILVEAILKLKPILKNMKLEGINNLSDEQWNVLNTINTMTSLINQQYNNMSNGDLPTIDTVIPSLKQLISALDKDIPIAKELKNVLIERMSSILQTDSEDFDEIYVMATSLNPQLAFLLSEDQIRKAKKSIIAKLQDRIRVDVDNRSRTVLGVDALLANVMNGNKSPDCITNNPIYGDILQQQIKLQQDRQNEKERVIEKMVNSYFEEILSGVDSMMSPFVRSFGNPFQSPPLYWHSCSHKYPSLSELALNILSIPSSSISSSRILSFHNSSNMPNSSIDSSLIQANIDRPERLERDLFIRFNRNFLPKSY